MTPGVRILRWVAIIMIVIGVAPIFTWALGGILASIAGCNYGGSVPCMLGGRDISGLIEELGMTSLFMLVTVIPLTIGLILFTVSAVRKRSAVAPTAPPPAE